LLLAFTLSFGKFWQAWQKKFTGDRGRAFAEASAYAQGYGAMSGVTETHEHKGDFKEW
jgi:hypothetical protein